MVVSEMRTVWEFIYGCQSKLEFSPYHYIKSFNSKGVTCISCGIYFTASFIPEV